MGSGTPIAQGAPATPQASQNRVTTFNNPEAVFGPNTFLKPGVQFTPDRDFARRANESLARSPEERVEFEAQRVAKQAEREASRPINPATGRPFDGFAGIPNLTTGDLGGDAIQTGDSGFSPEVFAAQQAFLNAPVQNPVSQFGTDQLGRVLEKSGGRFQNPDGSLIKGIKHNTDFLRDADGGVPLFLFDDSAEFPPGFFDPVSPTPAQLPQRLPPSALSDITRQVEEFERRGPQTEDEFSEFLAPPPPSPPPALSSNAAEAQRQISAANILQALETQTPGSVSEEKLGFASRVLKENFDRKRGDTTFDAFNPSSLGSGLQVAGGIGETITGLAKDFAGTFAPRVERIKNRLANQPPKEFVPNVTLNNRRVPIDRSQGSLQDLINRNRVTKTPTVIETLLNSQNLINQNRVTKSPEPQPRRLTPSATIALPFEQQQRLQDRARGGLVGLTRKGN
jgi:hypothetical protein